MYPSISLSGSSLEFSRTSCLNLRNAFLLGVRDLDGVFLDSILFSFSVLSVDFHESMTFLVICSAMSSWNFPVSVGGNNSLTDLSSSVLRKFSMNSVIFLVIVFSVILI